MRGFLVAALLSLSLTAPAPLHAQKKKAAPPPSPVEDKSIQTDAAGKKSKTYSFTGLDIDGKLKTPQLLYFLNRMKSEFDTTTPSRRSFLPELKRSTDEM
jgi:hypothetical protein